MLAGAAKDVAEKRVPSAHEGHSAAAAENSDELPGGQADRCAATIHPSPSLLRRLSLSMSVEPV